MSKARTVLKSSEEADFKTDLTFEFSENLMEIFSKNKSRNSVLHPLCVKVILMAKIGPSF